MAWGKNKGDGLGPPPSVLHWAGTAGLEGLIQPLGARGLERTSLREWG
jgi:hypothetical protein